MSESIGARLRAERARIGLSQEALAGVGGVKKLTQLQYEGDKSAPDARYLSAVAEVGIDVVFVLGLKRSESGSDARRQALLRNYEAADDEGKRIIEGTANLAAKPRTAQKRQG
jgi:transcriptional regulator with XRE-family HTH domain